MQNTTNLNIFLKSKIDIENAAQDHVRLIQSVVYSSLYSTTSTNTHHTNYQTLPLYIKN